MLAKEEIITEILPLKPIEKIELIDEILISLNQPNQGIDEIWEKEAQARVKAYDEGRIASISAEEVFKKYNI